MQPRILLLTVSLAANAALAFLIARADTAHPKYGYIMASTSSPAADAVSTPSTIPVSTASATSAASRTEAASGFWSRLYSDDLDQLTSRLKDAGFSYREIRAILMPLVQKKFMQLRADIMGPHESVPYWRASSVYAMPDDPAQRAKLSELMYTETKALRKYFLSADAINHDEDLRRQTVTRFGDLPLDKLQRLAQIEQDYQELQYEVYLNAQKRPRGDLGADERKQLQLLEAEQQRDFQQALTPEEYTEYLHRSSSTAQQLRHQLSLFRPTEEEYKTLFALQRPIDEQFNHLTGDETTYKARAEAMKNLQAQIETSLGPDRYADYKQAVENGNDKVTRLVARLDLPLRTVGQINAVRDDIAARAQAIRKDRQLSAAERDAQLSGLAQEARTKLASTLGSQRGLDAYADIKGDWLRALEPKP